MNSIEKRLLIILFSLIFVSCGADTKKKKEPKHRVKTNIDFLCECVFKKKLGSLSPESEEDCQEVWQKEKYNRPQKEIEEEIDGCADQKLKEHFKGDIEELSEYVNTESEKEFKRAIVLFNQMEEVFNEYEIKELLRDDIDMDFLFELMGGSWENYKNIHSIVTADIDTSSTTTTTYFGEFKGKNVFIQNEPVSKSKRTIIKVMVNGKEIDMPDYKNIAAFEVDFESNDIKEEDLIVIKIEHIESVPPKILNPEAADLVEK